MRRLNEFVEVNGSELIESLQCCKTRTWKQTVMRTGR